MLAREDRPIPEWPDGLAPVVVLATASGSVETTWHADGRVLDSASSSGSRSVDEETWLREPELHLLRVTAAEVTRLRGLHGRTLCPGITDMLTVFVNRVDRRSREGSPRHDSSARRTRCMSNVVAPGVDARYRGSCSRIAHFSR